MPESVAAQTGAPAAGTARAQKAQQLQVARDDIGFSSSLPADWKYIAPSPVPKALVPYPTAVAPKKGDACIDVALTARRGTSASVVVVVALPFTCYGQTLAAGDLANFGLGAAEGLKQSFEIASQAQANYSLGRHSFWIERADGTPKDRLYNAYTFEITCTVLEKGAVCWMTMAADAASLHEFERQAVTLDGERFDALVPAADAPMVPLSVPKKPS
jgi:hypothetical protein